MASPGHCPGIATPRNEPVTTHGPMHTIDADAHTCGRLFAIAQPRRMRSLMATASNPKNQQQHTRTDHTAPQKDELPCQDARRRPVPLAAPPPGPPCPAPHLQLSPACRVVQWGQPPAPHGVLAKALSIGCIAVSRVAAPGLPAGRGRGPGAAGAGALLLRLGMHR